MQAGGGGFASIALAGLQALNKLKFEEAEPLLDEMLSCVQFIPDPSKIDQFTGKPLARPVDWENDVEEVATIVQLRSEVVEVHTGFSVAAFLSRLGMAAKAKLNSPDIKTSPVQSE
jgi:hypothetical protein